MMPIFILIIAFMLVAMQYKQLHAFVAAKPMALDALPVSPQAEEKVRARIRDFFGAASADTLALSAEEINHLSRTSKSLSDQHLDYHLDLVDTLLVARNSLPVGSLRGGLGTMAGLLRVKGFLNSEMKGYPELKEGKITMIPVGAVMNGLPAPASVLSQKGPIDVREWVEDKDFYDKALQDLSEVKVLRDHLLLIKKHRS